jgi:Flp pilus assembly protein TadD
MNNEKTMSNLTGIKKETQLSRLFFIFLMSLLLFSCAGGGIKDDSDTGSGKPSTDYVDVDFDVEQDFRKAIILLQQDNNEQAIVVLKTVIEREQRLPAPYVNLAIAYNRLGETKSAEENLISALKLDIGHPVANNELGLLYRKTGKFNAARTAYQNAITQHPEYSPARKNLGVLCDLYLHDFNCALEQFEYYLELKPDDKTVAIWVVDVKRRLGK